MSNINDLINNSLGDFKLDLLGVVNLFGGDIALSAMQYCVLERRRVFWSAYLSPGTFTVATKLLKRADNTLATSLSPGPRDECRDIVGLLESGKYSYIGLISGTNMTVSNIIGEAVLNVAQSRKHPKEVGVNPTRKTRVDVVSVRLDPEENRETKQVRSYESLPRWYDMIFPVFTLGVCGFILWLRDWVGALIVIIGIISNVLLMYAACASGCEYMPGKPADGSPKGNCVVKCGTTPNQLFVVIGEEYAVQRLLQRPILVELDRYWRAVNAITGLFVYLYTAFSVIALPFVGAPEQLMLGVLYFVGLFANITYARRDGDALLAKIAEKDVGLKYEQSFVFPTRASAIAYCVLRCESDSSNLNDLLPNNTPIWIQWRRLLTHLSKSRDLQYEKTREMLEQWQDNEPEIGKIKVIPKDRDLWNRLVDDLLLSKEIYLHP